MDNLKLKRNPLEISYWTYEDSLKNMSTVYYSNGEQNKEIYYM